MTSITPYRIKKILNIHTGKVARWIKQGLPCEYIDPVTGRKLINLKDFDVWVKDHPDELAGCDIDGLSRLIGDRALVEKIAAIPKHKGGKPRSVTQLSPVTRTFPTMREAAESCFVNYAGLSIRLTKARKQGLDKVVFCGVEFAVEGSDWGEVS